MNITPFEPDRYLGTVTQVTPDAARANLPFAAAVGQGITTPRGIVGDFVFVESEPYALFGRITEVRLPDRERLAVEPELGKAGIAHPIGQIQLLTSVHLATWKLTRGLATHPKIGDRVFAATPGLVAWMAEGAATKEEAGRNPLVIRIGRIAAALGSPVCISPDSIFGRHCGIFGTTGSGKSYTLSKLIEETKRIGGKAILFDPSGEFRTLKFVDRHVVLGAPNEGEEEVSFSYKTMVETDLFALFRPSGSSQGPKLREAIRSLKLVEASRGRPGRGVQIDDGCIVKANMRKDAFFRAIDLHVTEMNNPKCNFDIRRLTRQIDLECVFPSARNDQNIWGNVNENDRTYCAYLVSRIELMIGSVELRCLFQSDAPSLDHVIAAFLEDNTANVLRVNMENLSFQYSTREIVANAIARHLIDSARAGQFRNRPTVIFLDEAHQFLNKSLGDEANLTPLEAFGLVAKEGRKYGLTCVLATQRPRDIPDDVLSQLGGLLVHRLINDRDRSAVERACGELDRSAIAFVPTLEQGEAILVGAGFPMPVPIKIDLPTSVPESRGPNYQNCWGNPAVRAA